MTKPVEEPQWVRIAKQFEQSGLTQKQFAQQHGLPLSTVQSWIYRRRRQASRSSVQPVRLLPVVRLPNGPEFAVCIVSGDNGDIAVEERPEPGAVRVGPAPDGQVVYRWP